MGYREIVRIPLIFMVVIRIHQCPWDLAAILPRLFEHLRLKMGIVKEPKIGRTEARRGQRHVASSLSNRLYETVIPDRKRNRVAEETKVTGRTGGF